MHNHHLALRDTAAAKAARATADQCRRAIADCHDTLRVGGYSTDDAYGMKLWAEIDAYRDRMLRLQRKGA